MGYCSFLAFLCVFFFFFLFFVFLFFVFVCIVFCCCCCFFYLFCVLASLFVCFFFTKWEIIGINVAIFFINKVCTMSVTFAFPVNSSSSMSLHTIKITHWFCCKQKHTSCKLKFDDLKGVLHLWALFLKTLCIFSNNKATSDKVSYGSGQKCSKELEN